jgi:hypothetical protein
MPGRGLERAQPIERGQPRGHLTKNSCMSLCHLKRNKVSFAETPRNADIAVNKLSLGDSDVHMFT